MKKSKKRKETNGRKPRKDKKRKKRKKGKEGQEKEEKNIRTKELVIALYCDVLYCSPHPKCGTLVLHILSAGFLLFNRFAHCAGPGFEEQCIGGRRAGQDSGAILCSALLVVLPSCIACCFVVCSAFCCPTGLKNRPPES